MAENPKNLEQEKFPFFSLSHQNQLGFGFFGSSEKPRPPPPPCVEVLFSEALLSAKSTLESINLEGGLTLHKGQVSTSDVFGVSNSDLVPGKYEGGLKLWEGSLDLVKTLISEVRDGHLSLTGKRVLELGCGHGFPGIFTCLEGAAVIHFQDFNAEVLRCLTIPNVKANLSKEPLLQQSLLKNGSDVIMSADIRFFAGDWSEVHHLLSPKCDNECQKAPDSSSKHDPCDGYDIILMAETVYSLSSLQSLYGLMKKCLYRPHGVVYLAAKKHYFGVGGGTRQFRSVVEEDGVMASVLIAEVADGSSNVREVWKFSFK
ncbi:uncharacterized protein LOC131225402 [Magnolia sinica]|uniref:uncharacterized protein LOC131225402 n=1 Tax=Magnolia sinica TaxID=86752 RepID=UPI0026587E90|nr:uncharacterized protein LOC131225402 [Magnolia sinica]